MSKAEDLETKQQRKRHALERECEREQLLEAVKYPKRKTVEMNGLAKLAKAAHELLKTYDVAAATPPLADLVQNTFNETVAQLNTLCTDAAK